MGSYLVRRFLLMVLTLFGMSVLIFVMLRLVPGNIADILVDASGADPKEKAKIARELGIDRPIAEQYVAWVNGLAHGDLGYAYVSERPAIELRVMPSALSSSSASENDIRPAMSVKAS